MSVWYDTRLARKEGEIVDKVILLVEWLRTRGEMEFPAFVEAARQAGLDPAVWHNAKRRGFVVTAIRDGKHYIKAVNNG